MEGKRLIKSLHIQNFLSYGSEGQELRLEPLNVLIGANASGKSNIIEAIGLLQATPTDLTRPIREGGGISDWLWKGGRGIPTVELAATIYYPEGTQPLRYRLALSMSGQRPELVDEAVENSQPDFGFDDAYFYYRYQHGRHRTNLSP